MTHHKPVVLAFVAYYSLVGLFYLLSAITTLACTFIVYASERKVAEQTIAQNLFYNQTKILQKI